MNFSFKKMGNKMIVYCVCACYASVMSYYKLSGGRLEVRFRVDFRKHGTCILGVKYREAQLLYYFTLTKEIFCF